METPDAPGDDVAFPPLIFEEETPQPSKAPPGDAEEIARALATVRTHHPRIAHSLQEIWGYRECADYLEKLVFNCSDPADLKRIGFDPEVMDALLILSRLHTITAR